MATESQIEKAFLAGVRSTVDAAKFNALRDAIGRGDYDAALRAVDIDDAAFDKMRALLTETYAQGGVNAITGTKWPVNVRWNSATPEAEFYARNVVGGHITVITNDMKEAVRWTMGDGIALGRSNNRIALDIVGRLGKSGAREGGIVGLNRPQAQWVANARRYLESGDYAAWNRLTLKDKRFKFSVDKPPTPAQIERAVQQYSNKMLLSRGLTIARTERGTAINRGMMEGYRQASAKTGIPLSAFKKTWIHTGSHRYERLTHVLANGESVQGLNTPFIIGGTFMQCPHDVGAPASEVVNCGCRFKVTVPRSWRNG